MKKLDFMNYRFCEKKKHAREYISNIDSAILEYYRVFARRVKPLRQEPQLEDFY